MRQEFGLVSSCDIEFPTLLAWHGTWTKGRPSPSTVYSSICLETNAGLLANPNPNSRLSATPFFHSLLRMTARPDYGERPLALSV
jgi:hypothetical protein